MANQLFNQLILIRTSYEQYHDAIELGKRAENLYNQSLSIEPFLLQEIISIDSLTNKSMNRREEYEQIYTHTLFFLAQIYAKLNQKDQSASYCRLTLERQLAMFNRNNQINFDCLFFVVPERVHKRVGS